MIVNNGKIVGTVYAHVIEILQRYDRSEQVTLDIGCGGGEYSRYLKSYYIGIDRSEPSYAGRGPSLFGDAQELPIRCESIDLAFMVGVLYEVPDVESALSEAYRVLKSNGHLVVFDYNRATTKRLKRILSESGIKHTHEWTSWQLSSRLRSAGFRTKVIWDYLTETDATWKRALMNIKSVRLLRFLKSQLGEGWNIVVGTKE